MSARILLIEDDPRLAAMLSQYLGEAGFSVTHAGAGAAGLALAARATFDVLVLDLTLPDMDGLEVCRQLRAKSDLPVLMLTARGDAMDRVVGRWGPTLSRQAVRTARTAGAACALLRRGRGAARDETLRFGRLKSTATRAVCASMARSAH